MDWQMELVLLIFVNQINTVQHISYYNFCTLNDSKIEAVFSQLAEISVLNINFSLLPSSYLKKSLR